MFGRNYLKFHSDVNRKLISISFEYLVLEIDGAQVGEEFEGKWKKNVFVLDRGCSDWENSIASAIELELPCERTSNQIDQGKFVAYSSIKET